MDTILDTRRPSTGSFVESLLRKPSIDSNPHLLSSVPRSIIDIAKILKGRDLYLSPRISQSSVECMDSMIGLLISKNSTYIRLFSDPEMLKQSGGRWMINETHAELKDRLDELKATFACETEISDITSSSKSQYHFCTLALLSPPRVPQALVVTQKAAALKLIDGIVESIHRRVD